MPEVFEFKCPFHLGPFSFISEFPDGTSPSRLDAPVIFFGFPLFSFKLTSFLIFLPYCL